jgi:hypothetical protein
MTTGLIRFTQRARAGPRIRFNALMGLLFDPEGLHASFARQKGKKAPGVDGIRKVDYAQGLEARLQNRWLPPLRIYHNLYPIPLWKTRAGSRMV